MLYLGRIGDRLSIFRDRRLVIGIYERRRIFLKDIAEKRKSISFERIYVLKYIVKNFQLLSEFLDLCKCA